MNSVDRLAEQLRDQQAVLFALEQAVADNGDVVLRLGDEIREAIDEVVDRLDTNTAVRTTYRGISV